MEKLSAHSVWNGTDTPTRATNRTYSTRKTRCYRLGDLVICLDLVSFDGKKSLTLADDGIATMEDKTSGSAKATSGTWEVSGQRDHYLIKFGDQEASFERIAPSGADMCILAAGSAYAADLRQSWFAIRPDDGPPDEQ